MGRRWPSWLAWTLAGATLAAASARGAETLDDAWAISQATNERLQASRCEVASAQHRASAATAQYWPSVHLNGGYTLLSDAPSFRLGPPGGSFPLPEFLPYAQRDSFRFGARATLPLYTSGRIRRGVDAACADLSAARHEAQRTLLDLKLAVAEAYIQVLRAQRDVTVARCNVDCLCAHCSDAEQLYQQGVVARNDWLAAQVSWTNARHEALAVENAQQAARARYNRYLGRPLDEPVELEEPTLDDTSWELDQLVAEALARRPEVASLSAQASALEHQAASIQGAGGPQVGLHGRHDYQQNRFVDPNGIASIGVGVEWDIFQGGARRHQVCSLRQQASGTRHLREEVIREVALQVREAWLDVETARERVTVNQQAIEQSEENFRIAAQRYREKACTNTEVLDAERLRRQSYSNFHHSRYDAAWSALRLRRAVGSL